MSVGWIKTHRRLQDNPMWLAEPFTRGQAWVDLLILTNHEDGYIRVAGQRIDIKRGQCGWSILNLSKRWKWSRGKANRFLNELKKDGQIDIKTDTRNSIITICNYSKYQDKDTAGDTIDSTTNGHQTDIKQYTNKNDKKNKNEKKGGDVSASPKPLPRKIGKRLGEDWWVPDEWGEWAMQEFNWNVEKVVKVAEVFKDHWLSQGGSKGVKLNWESTWRNWCRRENEGF